MAIVAGEVLIDRVDVEKAVAFRVQLFELFAAALGENDVAGVAIAGLDLRLPVGTGFRAESPTYSFRCMTAFRAPSIALSALWIANGTLPGACMCLAW